MRIEIVSFGRQHRRAPPAVALFDVRHCRNPWSVPELRKLNGRAMRVRDYVFADPAAVETFQAILDYICSVVRNTSTSSLKFAIGCFGGKHRSVAFVEALEEALIAARSETDDEIVIEHLELS